MKVAHKLDGLTFQFDAKRGEFTRDRIRVFQHAEGRWIATAPGCSAAGYNDPAKAVKLLRARIASAAKTLGLMPQGVLAPRIGGVK